MINIKGIIAQQIIMFPLLVLTLAYTSVHSVIQQIDPERILNSEPVATTIVCVQDELGNIRNKTEKHTLNDLTQESIPAMTAIIIWPAIVGIDDEEQERMCCTFASQDDISTIIKQAKHVALNEAHIRQLYPFTLTIEWMKKECNCPVMEWCAYCSPTNTCSQFRPANLPMHGFPPAYPWCTTCKKEGPCGKYDACSWLWAECGRIAAMYAKDGPPAPPRAYQQSSCPAYQGNDDRTPS